MLLIIAVLAVAAALVTIVRVPRSKDAGQLGWMSERWLAEHRATHPS